MKVEMLRALILLYLTLMCNAGGKDYQDLRITKLLYLPYVFLVILSPTSSPRVVRSGGGLHNLFGYTCIGGSPAESVQWLLNGSLFETLNLKHARAFVDKIGSAVLRFMDVPLEYNMTRIACRDASGRMSAENLLLVQGNILFNSIP